MQYEKIKSIFLKIYLFFLIQPSRLIINSNTEIYQNLKLINFENNFVIFKSQN